MSGLRIVVFLLMLPCTVFADFQAEAIGKTVRSTSLLVEPPVTLISRESAAMMFNCPHDASRIGFSMGYTDADFQLDPYAVSSPLFQKRFSAAAVGGLALSNRVGLFGKVGMRYSSNVSSLVNVSDGAGYVLQWARRYGVGLNFMANEVLSLHFEWERQAPGGIGAGVDLTKADWDPWKEKNMFGAGLRYGF